VSGSSICPRFHKAIELVGSRWTGAILQVLMAGPTRFSTIREAVGDISDRMLSERLQELEREAIVSRTVLPDPPIRVEYALSEKGRELQATLAAIGSWAEKWVELPHGGAHTHDAAKAAARATAPTRPRRTAPARRVSRRATP
jgi:DNA-binding HxlR family transcriptional regulator